LVFRQASKITLTRKEGITMPSSSCPKCGRNIYDPNFANWDVYGREKLCCSCPEYDKPRPHTKIRISFKSETQLHGLVIILEEYVNGKIDHATILYTEEKLVSEIIVEEPIHIIKESHIYPK